MAITEYLKDVYQYPLLSRDEEKKLATKSQLGDKVARDKLIYSNLRLVISIARVIAFRRNYLEELEDLIQEGNKGLMKAVDMYDPSLGHKFSTYATLLIRQHIHKYLQNNGRTIRLPVHRQELLTKINKIRGRYAQELGDEPSYEEIALELEASGKKYSPQQIEALIKLFGDTKTLSLDRTIKEDEDDPLINFVRDKRKDTELFAIGSIAKQELEKVLNDLEPKEKFILQLRFGIGCVPETLEEVGSHFGVTRERIRQIQNRALAKFKTKIAKFYPDLYHLMNNGSKSIESLPQSTTYVRDENLELKSDIKILKDLEKSSIEEAISILKQQLDKESFDLVHLLLTSNNNENTQLNVSSEQLLREIPQIREKLEVLVSRYKMNGHLVLPRREIENVQFSPFFIKFKDRNYNGNPLAFFKAHRKTYGKMSRSQLSRFDYGLYSALYRYNQLGLAIPRKKTQKIQRRLFDSQINIIIAAHKIFDGNASEVAKYLPHSTQTILRHWKKAKLRIRKRGQKDSIF